DRPPLFGNTASRKTHALAHYPRFVSVMFSKLLGNIKKQRKPNSWHSSVLGRAINEHIKAFDKAWKHLAKEEKEQLASEFNEKISAVLESSVPIINCRRELVTNVVAYTDLQVLCLTVEDKESNHTFKEMKRISSELQNYIYKCSIRNNELNKFIEENV